MKLIYDVLDKQSIQELIEIGYFELKYFACGNVPKYQTWNNIHTKYSHINSVTTLVKKAETLYETVYNSNCKIKSFWFNLVKPESDYDWHRHYTTTCIFYLLGTNGNGTMVRPDIPTENEYVIPSVDNSMGILHEMVLHKTPQWKGTDRISIAMGFDD